MKSNIIFLFVLGLLISIVGTLLINYVFIGLLGFPHTAQFTDAILYAVIAYNLFRYTDVVKHRVLIVVLACTPLWLTACIDLYEFFVLDLKLNVIRSLIRYAVVIFVFIFLLYVLQRNKRAFYIISISVFLALFSYNFIDSQNRFKDRTDSHSLQANNLPVSNIYKDSLIAMNIKHSLLNNNVNKTKTVLLTFSSDFCAPCIRLKKNVLSISSESIDSTLVINVFTAKDSSTYLKYLDRYPNVQNKYLTILDADSMLYKKFEIESFPQTYLVDSQGNIVWWHAGFDKSDNLWFADELKKRIAALPDDGLKGAIQPKY